jgi:hypothetical protein
MRALRAAGLKLSEAQTDLATKFVEAGDKASAQKIVIDALRDSVAGAGEADTKGLFGATKKMSRAWDELQKAVGKKLFKDSANDMAHVTQLLQDVKQYADETELSWSHLLETFGKRAANPLAGLADEITKKAFPAPKNFTAIKPINTKAADEVDAILGQARGIQLEADNKRTADAKAALAKLAELTKLDADNRLLTTKAELDREQGLYELYYSLNLVDASSFYAKRREEIQRGTASELAEGEQVIKGARKAACRRNHARTKGRH